MKHLIKTIIKIGILYKNDQFNQEELDVAENFKKKFNSLMMTIVSFIQVDFTYDRDFLISNMNECKQLLKQLVVRHLTEKSLLRIESFFAFFLNEGILDASFRPNGPHRGVLDKIAEDLSTLLENGVIWLHVEPTTLLPSSCSSALRLLLLLLYWQSIKMMFAFYKTFCMRQTSAVRQRLLFIPAEIFIYDLSLLKLLFNSPVSGAGLTLTKHCLV